jgi:hypothetical protein
MRLSLAAFLLEVGGECCPTSFDECLNDNNDLDYCKLREYNEYLDNKDQQFLSYFLEGVESGDDSYGMPAPKRKRVSRRAVLQFVHEDGSLVDVTAKDSTWYRCYVSSGPHVDCTTFQKKFRLCFLLPYGSYLELIQLARHNNWFPRWNPIDDPKDNRRTPTPLELLILGALHYLGRSWTFDDLEPCFPFLCLIEYSFYQSLNCLRGVDTQAEY